MKAFKYIALSSLVVAATSCKKNFEEINVDPDRPVEAPLENILAGAIANTVGATQGVNLNLRYGGLWVQHYSQIEYNEQERYVSRPADMDAAWVALYNGGLINFKEIETKAAEEGRENLQAIAKTLSAYIYSVTTDLWGSIPYGEALRADEGILSPAYDDQSTVYSALLDELDAANDLFASGDDVVTTGDYLFNGDMDKWRRFCNSLRLRLAMRLSDVDAGQSKSVIETITGNPSANPIMEGADHNVMLTYDDGQNRNPFFEEVQAWPDIYGVSKQLVDFMSDGDRNDPRLSVYALPNANGIIAGNLNGDLVDNPRDSISVIGIGLRTEATTPLFLMTAEEVQFIIAEAAQKGWSVGTSAKAAYEAAITLSMERHGIDGGATATYLGESKVSFDAASNKEQVIAEEKWVALFGQGVEAYCSYRKSGYPNLPDNELVNSAAISDGRGVPHRLAYPVAETTTNGTNVSNAKSDQGVEDDVFGRVWWDVN